MFVMIFAIFGFMLVPAGAQQAEPGDEMDDSAQVINGEGQDLPAPDSTTDFEGGEFEILPLSPDDVIDISSFEEATLSEKGSLYATGDNETINFTVGNDVIFAGGDLVINGDVSDNVVFAGSALELNGDVNGDVLFAGGTLIVNGSINGDLRAIGGGVYVNSETITGDMFIRSGTASISSDSLVDGESDIMSWNVDRSASDNPTRIEDVSNNGFPFGDSGLSSVIDGITTGFAVFSIIWGVLMMLGTILAGYFILRVFPTFSEKTLLTMRKSAAFSIFSGCLVLIFGIFIALMLLISLIGIQLLAVLALLGILSYVMGGLYARYEVGRMILVKFGYDKAGRFMTLLSGVLLIDVMLLLLGLLPLLSGLGWIIGFLLAVWGMGAIVLNKYNALRGK